MDSFHLPLRFYIYKSLFIVYVSIKIHKILSDNYLHGTQRQLFIHCCLGDCGET
ncbi:unnamed protein product [Brassica rapa subsp. trilocularis]